MKHSCSSQALAAAGATDFRRMIDAAAVCGFDGVDLEFAPGSIVSPAEFSFRETGALVQYALAKRVEVQCIGGGAFRSPRMADEWEGIARLISVAHALACPLVRVVMPPLGDEARFDEEYDAALALLREALDFARELDLCIGIEPAAGSYAATIDEALAVIEDANRRNLGVVYNPAVEAAGGGGSPDEAVERARGLLLLVRLAGGGDASIARRAFDAALNAARASGFSEYVSDCSVFEPGLAHQAVKDRLVANLRHVRALCTAARPHV